MRLLLLPLLLLLTTCSECYAGYSVYVAPMIPEFRQVNGPYGQEMVPNPERLVLPSTYGLEICRPDNYSPYAADPARRSRVYQDSAGIATAAQVFIVCPALKSGLIARAKAATAARLAQTDYKVIKQVEGVYTLTAQEKADRQALRDKFTAFESAITAATTVEQLLSIVWND